MANESAPPDRPDAGAPPEETAASQTPELKVVAQYVKDHSFENPGAPAFISPPEAEEQPNAKISVDVKRRQLSGDDHEILLDFTVEAKQADGTIAFILELVYAGVFTVRGFDDDARTFILSVECPRLLFPFARRVLADSVRDGGYPPLILGPIDFAGLYKERGEREQSVVHDAPQAADA